MQRALTLLEKYQLVNYAPFVGVLEMRALLNAKYWFDFEGSHQTLSPEQVDTLKAFAEPIYRSGYLPNNVSFARTWLTLYEGAVEVGDEFSVQSVLQWMVSQDQVSVNIDHVFKLKAGL